MCAGVVLCQFVNMCVCGCDSGTVRAVMSFDLLAFAEEAGDEARGDWARHFTKVRCLHAVDVTL